MNFAYGIDETLKKEITIFTKINFKGGAMSELCDKESQRQTKSTQAKASCTITQHLLQKLFNYNNVECRHFT